MKLTSLILTITFSLFSVVVLNSQEKFPDVQVMNDKGESVDLQEYVKGGGPKIVSLWATWCGPCRMELNALKKVAPQWKSKYDLEIVTVSVDVPRMVTKAKQMATANGWEEYTFMYDGDQKVMSQLGLNSIPHSWLVDENGNIISVMVGYSSNYEQHIERKLRG